jgi:hypothetical protein
MSHSLWRSLDDSKPSLTTIQVLSVTAGKSHGLLAAVSYTAILCTLATIDAAGWLPPNTVEDESMSFWVCHILCPCLTVFPSASVVCVDWFRLSPITVASVSVLASVCLV